MGRIWDFFMRRKPLFFGFLLIFIVSAAFSSVYLRPVIVNTPVGTPAPKAVAPTPDPEPDSQSDPEPAPQPNPQPDPNTQSDPEPQPVSSTVHLAIIAPTPEEVVALGETISIPRTNFGFALPGNIINFASLDQVALKRQVAQVSAVKTWHYIVSATTAALIFGAVMLGLARFLSKNMLE